MSGKGKQNSNQQSCRSYQKEGLHTRNTTNRLQLFCRKINVENKGIFVALPNRITLLRDLSSTKNKSISALPKLYLVTYTMAVEEP